MKIDYSQILYVHEDGRIWWKLEDAYKLGAGYQPMCDDNTVLSPILSVPATKKNRADVNVRNLLGAFNQTPEDERPPTQERMGPGGASETYVNAAVFIEWLSQYVAQNQAEIDYPNDLARAMGEKLREAQRDGIRLAHFPCPDDGFTRLVAQQEFLDGYNHESTERLANKFHPAAIGLNLADERCRELALAPSLTYSEWFELTGVNAGDFGLYVISFDEVGFNKRWDRKGIENDPPDMQKAALAAINSPRLRFPCTPRELIDFVDSATHGGSHFEIPEEFRRAVEESEQPFVFKVRPNDLPLLEFDEQPMAKRPEPAVDHTEVATQQPDERRARALGLDHANGPEGDEPTTTKFGFWEMELAQEITKVAVLANRATAMVTSGLLSKDTAQSVHATLSGASYALKAARRGKVQDPTAKNRNALASAQRLLEITKDQTEDLAPQEFEGQQVEEEYKHLFGDSACDIPNTTADAPTASKKLVRIQPEGGDALTPWLWKVCYDLYEKGTKPTPRLAVPMLLACVGEPGCPVLCSTSGGIKFELRKGEDVEVFDDAMRKRIKSWREKALPKPEGALGKTGG